MKTAIRRTLIGGLAVFAGAQFIPIARTNPPVTGDLAAPPEVQTLLRNACYDCHSHETIWPWYGRVAPVSWLLAADVHEARRKLNFSTWTDYPPDHQAVLKLAAAEQVREREMPPLPYTWMHPRARLAEPQSNTLASWLTPEDEK